MEGSLTLVPSNNKEIVFLAEAIKVSKELLTPKLLEGLLS